LIQLGCENEENLKKNEISIKHCAVALGRIASADDQFVKLI
jgi:hypothetical protein